jgi:hypothetical protein
VSAYTEPGGKLSAMLYLPTFQRVGYPAWIPKPRRSRACEAVWFFLCFFAEEVPIENCVSEQLTRR